MDFSYYMRNPRHVVSALSAHGMLNWMSDEAYLRLRFREMHGMKLNLDKPTTFNEKLQWLKLHDRNPLYITLVDKVAVKGWVADCIGEEYIVPTYAVWEDVDDINLDFLPERFVLKTNHDNSGVVLCKDRSLFDFESAKKKLRSHLNRNFFWIGREWPYKDVPHRVFAEKYLEPDDGLDDLADYKVLCFGGEPGLIELHRGRWTDAHTQDFYTCDWELTTISQDIMAKTTALEPRPAQLKDMLELSRALSQCMAHVRIDWFISGGKLWLGEITFYDGSGFDSFVDLSDDLALGALIDLSLAYGPFPND